MPLFHFKVDRLHQSPVEKTRTCENEAEAIAYARQLLTDWPDCAAIDVLQSGALVDRLRPTRA